MHGLQLLIGTALLIGAVAFVPRTTRQVEFAPAKRSFSEEVRPSLLVARLAEPLSTGALRAHRVPGAAPPRVVEPKAQQYVQELLEAVEFLHGRRIAHRDIKVSNIMLTVAGRLVLCDFGLATQVDPAQQRQLQDFCGTCGYAAPEVARSSIGDDEPVDVLRADVFACGVVAFRLLTGQKPFAGKSDQEVMQAARKHLVQWAHLDGLPAPAQHAVKTLLAKLPERPTAIEALHDPWHAPLLLQPPPDKVELPEDPDSPSGPPSGPASSWRSGPARAPSFVRNLSALVRSWRSSRSASTTAGQSPRTPSTPDQAPDQAPGAALDPAPEPARPVRGGRHDTEPARPCAPRGPLEAAAAGDEPLPRRPPAQAERFRGHRLGEGVSRRASPASGHD